LASVATVLAWSVCLAAVQPNLQLLAGSLRLGETSRQVGGLLFRLQVGVVERLDLCPQGLLRVLGLGAFLGAGCPF
jgi:hypothetical protein